MFEPGARVVCVDDRFPPGIRDIFNALPVKGREYVVRDLVRGRLGFFEVGDIACTP